DGFEEDLRVRPAEKLDPAEARRAERVAVVSAVERDEAALLRCPALFPALERHLDRDLDRAGAVVRVEYMIEAGRRDGDQLLGEPDGRLVRHPGERAMIEHGRLFAQHLRQARVAVAERGDPP